MFSTDSNRRPNVLVLVLDTARAANLSCYGHNKETSPNIDEIADEGIRYENAITNAPWTLPAHASMFTGRLPFEHGAHARNYKLDDSIPTLAEILANEGYETSIISNNGWLSDGFGVLRGFQNEYKLWKLFQTDTNIVGPYREHVKHTNLLRDPESVMQFAWEILREGNPLRDLVNMGYGVVHRDEYHHSGDRITRILKKQIADSDGPFFTVANYLEPHLQYSPPEPYRSNYLSDDVTDEEVNQICQNVYEVMFGDEELTQREWEILERLYDGEIAHVDSFVGEIWDFLRDEKILDETLLVLVGDHGENIGDHGLLGHNSCLYDTVLSVPMVIRSPQQRGSVVDRYVQLSDLFETVLSATGIDSPGGDTFSFDLLDDDLGGRPEYAIAQYAGLQLEADRIEQDYPAVDLREFDRSLMAIYEEDHKLIESNGGSRELYDLACDPEERCDMRTDRSDLTERLASKIRDRSGEPPEGSRSTHNLDAAIETRLKDLGYHK